LRVRKKEKSLKKMKKTERIFQTKDKQNELLLILCIVLGCAAALGLAAISLFQTMQANNDLAVLNAEAVIDPYAIAAAYGRRSTASNGMVMAGFLLVIAVICLIELLRRRKYKRHMDAYGVGEADFARFDRDMQGEIFKCAWHTVITSGFIFGKTPGHTYLFPLRDVVFIYQHVTGMTRVFYLCFRDGHLQTIPASEMNAPALQRFLSERCPNLVDFTEKERRDLWVKGRREIRRMARLRTAQYQGTRAN